MGSLRTYRQSIIVIAVLFGLSSIDALAQDGGSMTLERLLDRIEHHPELAMKQAGVEAAEARIPMRSSLMEPNLILGVQNVPTSLKFNEDPMTAKVIGMEQMFPFPGKLSGERSIGEFAVVAARAGVEEARNLLRREVKISWYDILHRQRSIDVNLRHVRLLEDFKQEIAVSIAYGKTPLAQLDQLELEQTEIEQMIAEDSAMIAMQEAKLEYMTGVSVGRLVQDDSLPMQAVAYPFERLVSEALAHNPRLKSIRAEIEASHATIDRAKLERYPDFDVMLMYMMRDDLAATGGHGTSGTSQMNMFSAQVSITLPFINYGGVNEAMVTEMESMRKMKLAEERMQEAEIRMMLREKTARLAELRRKHALFTSSVLPSLDTRIRSYLTDYQYDKGSLQSAVTQILDLLHKQHEVFELESEYQKTVAEIDFIIGSDLLSSMR